MKVGDLVELSVKSKKAKWARPFVNKIGLVVSIKSWLSWDSDLDTYAIQWVGELAPDTWIEFRRSDVRYVRAKK